MMRAGSIFRHVIVRALALLVPVVALLPTAATPACYGRECDEKYATAKPTDGHMLDEDTWESAGMADPWLEFPGAQYWTFDLAQLGGRQPDWIQVYLSTQRTVLEKDGNNNDSPRTFTPGGGNLVIIHELSPRRAIVANGTCAKYYMRTVVHAPRVKPGAGVSDAGSSDATSSDASTSADASHD